MPGIQYFLYANAAGQLSGEPIGTYSGGENYGSSNGGAFLISVADANFLVEGTPVAAGVPEIDGRCSAVPLAALLCLLAVSRRRAWAGAS